MNQHHSFYQMDTRVFDQGLRPIPFAVYSYLVSCAGSRGSCFSSSQAPYPSPRREQQGSLIPLLLLFAADPLCWAPLRFIAGKCLCSESAVRDALRTLEDRGLIRREFGYRENRYGLRQQTSNTYYIQRLPDYYENGEPRYAERPELPL